MINRVLQASAGLAMILAAVSVSVTRESPTDSRGGQDDRVSALSVESKGSSAIVSRVVRVGCTVSDVDAAARFYTTVLGFEVVGGRDGFGEPDERLSGVFASRTRTVLLRLGEEEFELTEFVSHPGRPMPVDSRGNDQWFQHIAIVVSDIQKASEVLMAHGVKTISPGPQTLPRTIPNAAGISAMYFRDPDGHALEIIHFPPGKGDPRWQRSTDRVFLGIDHTAIACSNTAAALEFYSGVLGLRVAGESENFGTEQEHLNGVFNARVRITALKAEAGPGIELLEYLAPGPGRPTPIDSVSTDLWHWQVTITTSEMDRAYASLRAKGARVTTPAVIRHPTLGAAITMRDPDLHALLMLEGE